MREPRDCLCTICKNYIHHFGFIQQRNWKAYAYIFFYLLIFRLQLAWISSVIKLLVNSTIVIHLCKKGEKELASNYCPISLTCIACKVVEFIIKDEILLFMVKNKSFQHLSNQIFWSMLNNLTDATEHNIEVDLVYLDFAKSFVLLPPENLICKLEK